jgi:signal transduction histidine kinase
MSFEAGEGMAVEREVLQPFRPRARVLQLLGDELIGSPRLAVFELVKNAYDADANKVVVRLDLRGGRKPTITVQDDGEGMTLETIQRVWLVPGDDHREKQRRALARSARHSRLPLGEKGLGRFAVHKLGNLIRLVTRAEGEGECVVDINWGELIARPYLDEAPVRIRVRTPEVFTDGSTGTRIEIGELRQSEWTRGEVRRLQRQIMSICSPFEEPSGFVAVLEVLGREDWIADLPDAREIMDRSIWKFTFRLEGGRFDWRYEFRQVPGLKLDRREVSKSGDVLKLPSVSGDDRMERKVVADESTTAGIGAVTGEFYVFDREREVLRRLPNMQLISGYLDDNGGVRVYRDGIRVYNYGEPGDDWLGLDLRRVNAPTRGISRNIVLGAVHLSLASSRSLVEKTNREGFVENDAYERLRRIVLGALATLEAERHIDKDRIRKLTAKPDDPELSHISKSIDELRRALDRQGVRSTFEPYVAKIEHDYVDMQQILLSAGMSGLNLAVVFHEVERGVRALHQVIANGADPDAAARQARDLMHLLDGFSTLLRRDARSTHSARKLIEAARRFNVLRLRHHRVRLDCPLLETDGKGFEANFAFGLVVGALNNLIDNALYWMRVRWPELPPEGQPSPRRIYLGVSDDFEAGPAIIVADTGPGFQGDEPDRLVRPFFTRKPNGMGLGLYYANLAMELNGGLLAFPQPDEVDLPEGFDGAVMALVFRRLG